MGCMRRCHCAYRACVNQVKAAPFDTGAAYEIHAEACSRRGRRSYGDFAASVI